MKSKLLPVLFVFLLSASQSFARPSSVFWTNCTTDVVPKGSLHADVDNYFSVCNRGKNGHSFAPELGLTGGVFSTYNVDGEVGLEYLGGKSNPFLLNGKIGIKQGTLYTNSPSFSVGFFSVGTTRERNKSVFDAIIGYTFPDNFGKGFFGVYQGRHSLGKRRSGWMIAFERDLQTAKDSQGADYTKWQARADYASGKNSIGGAGVGLAYYFTPKINLVTGPIVFNDTKRMGQWKWTLQLNIDID